MKILVYYTVLNGLEYLSGALILKLTGKRAWNYAKHGVPVIFYFTGLHRDYHRTTDDVDKIDFEKMEHIARMIFATGWRVANLDHRVVVDKAAARSATR